MITKEISSHPKINANRIVMAFPKFIGNEIELTCIIEYRGENNITLFPELRKEKTFSTVGEMVDQNGDSVEMIQPDTEQAPFYPPGITVMPQGEFFKLVKLPEPRPTAWQEIAYFVEKLIDKLDSKGKFNF